MRHCTGTWELLTRSAGGEEPPGVERCLAKRVTYNWRRACNPRHHSCITAPLRARPTWDSTQQAQDMAFLFRQFRKWVLPTHQVQEGVREEERARGKSQLWGASPKGRFTLTWVCPTGELCHLKSPKASADLGEYSLRLHKCVYGFQNF